MDANTMDKVIEAFKGRDDFLITAHVGPEGDSIGSQLAIYDILTGLKKRAVMVDHDDVPANLKFLKGSGSIRRNVPEGFRPKTIVMLDCPVVERAGSVCEAIGGEQFVVNIDHHVSNVSFGDINWVEPDASSTGEMVFRLAEKMNISISPDMATAIYAAIVTDTGMFSYDNTSPETHAVAGKLISKGADPKEIHGEIFEKKTVREVRMLGRALSTIVIEEDGALAHMSLTDQMYTEEGISSVSTDEFIGFPRSIRDVEVVVFFKESPEAPGKVSVSFRSLEKVDVNMIASSFGGGGHARAAGCTLECSLAEARDRVLAEARKAIEAVRHE